MTNETAIASLPGAQSILDWFGYWPSFHDAEVLSIELNRQGTSRVSIHCFSMTNKLDGDGYFILEKHAVVSIFLEDISSSELANFNNQNVLFSLSINPTEEALEIKFDSSYGLSGHIAAKKIYFELSPGIPKDSMYSPDAE